MPELTGEATATLAIVVAALGLFVWDRMRPEVVGVAVMAVLVITGLVGREDGLSGFSNEATITVALMLALSVGLLRTGAIDLVGRWIARLSGGREFRLLLVVVLMVIPVSAFLNNTAVVAILIPAILGLTRANEISPSRILLPLSFASQLGGTLTLIGTSTNLLVGGLVLDLGLDRIRLFDITAPAAVLTAVGVVYLLTLGRWLTPVRTPPESLMRRYELHDYLTGLEIDRGSRLANRSLADTRFTEEYGLTVVAIERDGRRIHSLTGGTVLREGDLLLVEGKVPDIARIQDTEGIRIAGSTPPLLARGGSGPPAGDEPPLAELMVPSHSRAIGRSLPDLGFRTRFGVTVLAIQRHGQPVDEPVNRARIELGDLLLVQGPTEALHRLHEGRDLVLLGPVELPAQRRNKMRLAVGIMAGVVLLPALGVTTILYSALLGVLAMVITGCFTPEEAYEEIDWSVIILLGSLIPLGLAMEQTGAAAWIAAALIWITAPMGAYGLLAGLYTLTTALTAAISNAAAAVILTPMAVAAAHSLGYSPWPFVVAVMFAASNSFVTPIGYQTNLFVYGPGGYRFSDFARVGGPLTLLMIAAATLVIPLFFPFHAR